MVSPPIPALQAYLPLRFDEQDIHVYGSFDYEHRINLPAPHGVCITRFPPAMIHAYPLMKQYSYDKKICYAAKYQPITLLFPAAKGKEAKDLEEVVCRDQCSEQIFETNRMSKRVEPSTIVYKYVQVMSNCKCTYIRWFVW